jgi:hypothetical protein
MRIVFIMRNVGYLRNFEWVIRRLAERGHSIRLLFDHEKRADDRMQESSDKVAQAHLDVLVQDHPKIGHRLLNGVYTKPRTLQSIAARRLRLIQDYLRYLDPEFANAHKLRERAALFLRPRTRRIVDVVGRWRWSKALAVRFLSTLDSLIPPRDDVVDLIKRKVKADLLMVTPLFGHGSAQVDYFKACTTLGVRSCLPVASWDNLTSKGVVQCQPDRILVWNAAQKKEAVKLQRMPKNKVVVTGAHCYEHWFTWEPSTEKEAFLERVGLDRSRDYVLFLGSSRFIAEDEVPVVIRWMKALRQSSNPEVANIGILIRPHPQNYGAWMEADLTEIGNAVVYPRGSANPVSRDAKSVYFDTMYHCSAVVGVNTSAMIEAAILGKPVHTVLFEEMAGTQEGTLHFHHLSDESGGLLRVAHDLDEHVELLGRSLADPSEDEKRSKDFVDHFVWPKDLQIDSMVDCFADAIEAQLRAPAPSRGRKWLPLVWIGRVVASPLLLIYRPEYRLIEARRRERRRAVDEAKAAEAAMKATEGEAKTAAEEAKAVEVEAKPEAVEVEAR